MHDNVVFRRTAVWRQLHAYVVSILVALKCHLAPSSRIGSKCFRKPTPSARVTRRRLACWKLVSGVSEAQSMDDRAPRNGQILRPRSRTLIFLHMRNYSIQAPTPWHCSRCHCMRTTVYSFFDLGFLSCFAFFGTRPSQYTEKSVSDFVAVIWQGAPTEEGCSNIEAYKNPYDACNGRIQLRISAMHDVTAHQNCARPRRKAL